MDTSNVTEITPAIVLAWSAFIGVAAFVAYLVYRSIERPRLVLTPTPNGPRAMRRDVIKYAVTIPFLILLWWTFFFVVLLVNANEINAVQLVVFPLALIIAIRTLAFVAPHAATELAKVIPVALIAFVVIDGNIRPQNDLIEMLDKVGELAITETALLFLFAYDYLVTAIWYWGWIRWGKPHWMSFTAARAGKRASVT